MLRIGVIGTGFGRKVQIPAFQAHPRARVVAVASATPGRAAEVAARFDIPHAFDRWEDLIRADLDLVSITPHPVWHHRMALAAIAARRHVLCEKPMALNASEAAEMHDRAVGAGIVHAIDHELRFNPNCRKIKTLIDGGFIGHPRHALVTRVGTGQADVDGPWTWWSDAAQGGGLLQALGSHQIDLLRYWLGDFVRTEGTVDTYVKERSSDRGPKRVTSDDFTAFLLRFTSGAVATVVLTSVAARDEGTRFEIWGDEGTLRLDAEGRLWGTRGREPWREFTEVETLTPPPGMDYSPLWGLSFVRLANHLVTAILDGEPIAPAATFADGLEVQKALDAVGRPFEVLRQT